MSTEPVVEERGARRIFVDVAAAMMFLTRIPVPWERISDAPPDAARSVWAGPVIGVVVGGVGALVFAGMTLLGIPALGASLLAVVAQCLTTGAFHEDGLADVADGFGGGFSLQAKLDIMKDSRVGTYGALALIFAVGLRASAIAVMTPAVAAMALVAAGALSRSAVVLLLALPSARSDGLGAQLHRPGVGETTASVLLGAVPVFIAFGLPGALVPFAAWAIAVAAVRRLARRQIGGYTGDVLGAGQQVCEVVLLLVASVLLVGR